MVSERNDGWGVADCTGEGGNRSQGMPGLMDGRGGEKGWEKVRGECLEEP